MKVTCPRCENELDIEELHCDRCGYLAPRFSSAVPVESGSKKLATIVALGFCLLVLAGLALLPYGLYLNPVLLVGAVIGLVPGLKREWKWISIFSLAISVTFLLAIGVAFLGLLGVITLLNLPIVWFFSFLLMSVGYGVSKGARELARWYLR